ncbi:histidinol-phosphate transaminase [Simiduia agarivorans]|uniref:Histidinol-phosphate aminotransferase n=1 Tax=Simiduia agarivorans (strain DSM 21679 / JCM 13881 / BCRC 17597 / SA1) TaxID=1117647 RepID=K4KNF3_SIMAS|nr:histidinol-phosphate transaminase [Simiduia agarivorans]AFV00577.1 histidinol-phosphate aminotransferase [Simiduia agarivorans SA1 = DSM 21679]
MSQSRLWSPAVSRLEPYVPGEQPKVLNLVKLNTNESAFAPSPRVAKALSADQIDRLRLYPDPNSTNLKMAIARHFDLQVNQVFVGNGSDEVLAHAFYAFFQQASPLLFPDITYSFYPTYCNLYGIEHERIPLADDFSLNLADYHKPNGGIIFANPNAPTGMLVGLADIRALLEHNRDSVVLVDEAYIDFGGESAVSLINEFDNVLVVHTTSKSRALAGIRLGYALGHPGLIDALDRVKNSFNSYPVDRLAELAGIASFEDDDYFQQGCADVIANREFCVEQLTKLGFDVLPSAANFVFAKPTFAPAATVFEQLRERAVLVRYFNKPRISDYLRISIGSRADMKALVAALKDIVQKG